VLAYKPPDPTTLQSWYDLQYLPAAGTYFTVKNRIYVVSPIYAPGNSPNEGGDGTVFVNIPILVAFKYRIPGDLYQDKFHAFAPDDSQGMNSARVSRIVKVYSTGNLDFASVGGDNTGADSSQFIQVERLDNFSIYQIYPDGQVSQAGLLNVVGEGDETTPANFGPPNGQHLATHVVRWYKTDDMGNVTDPTSFVDTELIDKLLVQDVYKGLLFNWRYTLKNNWQNVPDSSQPLGFSTTQNPVPADVLNPGLDTAPLLP
jgi:hypothetical protein